MQYMLQVYGHGDARDHYNALSEDEQNAISGEYFAIAQAPGVKGGAQLQPAETATTVRVEDGKTLTTDGPFVELKEAVGGYCFFEADDLDAAIALAAKFPPASMGGAIEIRPLEDG